MAKRMPQSGTGTMIIPRGTEIDVDIRGQLNIRTPGNLVIENSGTFGIIESSGGSIRIEPRAEVEAVHVQCPHVCYVEGSLTAWRVSAHALQLENRARASIVLQETEELSIGKGARLIGNFGSEHELFGLFSRFAEQIRSMPLLGRRAQRPAEVQGTTLNEIEISSPPEDPPDLPDPLFLALVLLERESERAVYGPTSRRVIGELVELLRKRELETLSATYRTLCSRVRERQRGIDRALELMEVFFTQ